MDKKERSVNIYIHHGSERENLEQSNRNDGSNGIAVAAFVCGIIGFIFGLIPYAGWVLFPLWLLAIIFGIVGMEKKEGRNLARVGFFLGGGAFFYQIVILFIAVL